MSPSPRVDINHQRPVHTPDPAVVLPLVCQDEVEHHPEQGGKGVEPQGKPKDPGHGNGKGDEGDPHTDQGVQATLAPWGWPDVPG